MVKKNFLIILAILITILLIAFVVWAYHKRIERIENKMQTDKTYSSVKAMNELAELKCLCGNDVKNDQSNGSKPFRVWYS
jgi:hypothetical protein